MLVFQVLIASSAFYSGALAAPADNLRAVGLPLTRIQLSEQNGVFVPSVLKLHLSRLVSKYASTQLNYARNTGRKLSFPPMQAYVNQTTTSEDVMAAGSRGNAEFVLPASSALVPIDGMDATLLKKRAGREALASQDGLMWIGPITIGSNAQPFAIDFDTGSADLWVSSSKCAADCGAHKRYEATTSTSSQDSNTPFTIQYADGTESSGDMMTDTVGVAGLFAVQQPFAQVTAASEAFATEPEDGILGMAFQTVSTTFSPPYFQTLIQQRRVRQGIFAFRLEENSAELYLGGVNPQKYTGAFEWSDNNSDAYWSAEGSISVDGINILMNTFIFDTGSTLVIAPPSEATAFYANVPNSEPYQDGYYTYPCDQTPVVGLRFNKKVWPMQPSAFNLGTIGQNRCVGAVVGIDIGISAWILGDAFLLNVYAAFDVVNNRVGLARPR